MKSLVPDGVFKSSHTLNIAGCPIQGRRFPGGVFLFSLDHGGREIQATVSTTAAAHTLEDAQPTPSYVPPTLPVVVDCKCLLTLPQAVGRGNGKPDVPPELPELPREVRAGPGRVHAPSVPPRAPEGAQENTGGHGVSAVFCFFMSSSSSSSSGSSTRRRWQQQMKYSCVRHGTLCLLTRPRLDRNAGIFCND